MSASGAAAPTALADNQAGSSVAAAGVYAQGGAGTWNRIDTPTGAGDNADGGHELAVAAMVYTGTNWTWPRTPTKFKSGSFTAAGDTALWTPAAGKKFRLMGFAMYMAGDSSIAVAGEQVVLLRDAAVDTGIVRFNPFVPGAPVNLEQGGAAIQPLQLGNGYLSSAANNVLNVNLAVAYTGGNIDVMAWGTEE